jgi:GTP pyrophosphokinase
MAAGYSSIPFVMIFLNKYLGYYSLWVVLAPVALSIIYGMLYLEKLEKKHGRYDNYPHEDNPNNPDTAKDQEGYSYELSEEYKNYSLDCQYATDLLNRLHYRASQQNKSINIKMIEKSIIFAKKWHDGQYRDCGAPFYSHPLAVADIVSEYYLKTDVVIASILHDVVEDSSCTVDLINKEFNSRIAEIVSRLTKFKIEGDTKVKLSLEQTVRMLHEAGDNEALLIKQVDRLHNLHTMDKRSHDKRIQTALDTGDHLIPTTSTTADKLGVGNTLSLEDKLIKYCKSLLGIR